MAHTKQKDLDDLALELEQIRGLQGLTEKGTGIFYRGSNAFLHFHDKDGKRWAHVKQGKAWVELKIEFNASAGARKKFLKDVRELYQEFTQSR